MPSAIKEMDEHDRRIFLEAAKSGIAVRFNIRIILVGKQGVGKTCLLRRLMSEDIADVESTDGINIEVKRCKINLHTKEWIFNKGNHKFTITGSLYSIECQKALIVFIVRITSL